jgi:hypothetical protein
MTLGAMMRKLVDSPEPGTIFRWKCDQVPKGVEPDVSIKIRISFNRDGTLVSPPRLLVPVPTAKQQALMESAADALERCQPFTMLPA